MVAVVETTVALSKQLILSFSTYPLRSLRYVQSTVKLSQTMIEDKLSPV